MSKGSWKRPIHDKKKFDDNWDKIFKGRGSRDTNSVQGTQVERIRPRAEGQGGNKKTRPKDSVSQRGA